MNIQPELSGQSAQARDSSSKYIRILACAGSGKTETVAQKISRLISNGVKPGSILAFTFTIKAAEELRSRVDARLRAVGWSAGSSEQSQLFTGTIHSYANWLLRNKGSRYNSYVALDEQQMQAFLLLNYQRLDLAQYGSKDPSKNIDKFWESVAVVENELIPLETLPENFRDSLKKLYELLDEHKFLTFGLQIKLAIELLEESEANGDHFDTGLEHVIVDEYQDINKAQERFIRLLVPPDSPTTLTVVGDDDQSIYQWRGSSVRNIIDFTTAYPGAESFVLKENRRSGKSIVALASALIAPVQERVVKEMVCSNSLIDAAVIVPEVFDSESDEANYIADSILELTRKGSAYSSIAVLVRASTAYPKILKALESRGIPVASSGRTGLFETPLGDVFGRLLAWLVDAKWRPSRWSQQLVVVDANALSADLISLLEISASKQPIFREALEKLHAKVGTDSRTVSIVKELYKLLAIAGVPTWNLDHPSNLQKMSVLGQVLEFVSNYESVMQRARWDEGASKQIGAPDLGRYYFINLAKYASLAARGGFKESPYGSSQIVDAVELMTIHGAKGLEWPTVFVPSLTTSRFPNASQIGQKREWLVPSELFDVARYQGTLDDERRLMYVAVTRAKERIILTSHAKVEKGVVSVSPFWTESRKHADRAKRSELTHSNPPIRSAEYGFSDLNHYLQCGAAYLLRSQLHFPPVIVQQMGYGNAIHLVLEKIVKFKLATGRMPTTDEVEKIINDEFYLPFAAGPLAERLKLSGAKAIHSYLETNGTFLENAILTEFETRLDCEDFVVNGRLDLLTTNRDNQLTVIDFKTAVGEQDFSLQLTYYLDALDQAGMQVTRAEIHNLTEETVSELERRSGEKTEVPRILRSAVTGINAGIFAAKPSVSGCNNCDVNLICGSSLARKSKGEV